MIQRWLSSRTFRRFTRNKMAILSLLCILIFVAVAVATSVFGVVDLEATKRTVDVANVPGFGIKDAPEKRVRDMEFLLNQVDGAMRRTDPKETLKQIEFGSLEVVDESVEEIRGRLDALWKQYDPIAETSQLAESPEALKQLDALDTEIHSQLYQLKPDATPLRRSLELLLGTDRQGRSIFLRAIYSIEIAVKIGVVVGLISVLVGTVLGLAAGFYGGWVDTIISWLFTVFSSIPSLVLLVLLAAMFRGSMFEGTLVPMYIAFSMTYWVGPCRVVRGETFKLREQEYVHAATVAGFSKPYIMLRHIMPNTAHLMLIYFSLLFIAAVKGEVILTYLGLGIKNGTSWGIMISQSAPEVISGFFWQIGAATFFMFLLVLAFNILSDALQDIFDPKHV